jgi:hypothetical protein
MNDCMVNMLRKIVHQVGFIYKIIYMIIEKTCEIQENFLEERVCSHVNKWLFNLFVCLFVCFSSCFQLVGKESYDLNDMQSLLQDPNNIDLYDVYNKYNVEGVQVNMFKTCEIKLPFNIP